MKPPISQKWVSSRRLKQTQRQARSAKLSIWRGAAIVCSDATLSLSTSPHNPLCFPPPCPRLVLFHSLTFIVSPPSSLIKKVRWWKKKNTFCLASSSSLSRSQAPLTLASLCQMSFYLSQQSLSVQGPFRVHIGKEARQTRNCLEMELARETVS